MKLTFPRAILAFSLAVPLIGHSQTVYTWSGATDGNWQTSSNWSPSQPASGTTINGRINVNNGSGNALQYTSAEGTTTLTGTGVRGLVIGSSASGAMVISGGSFSTAGTDTGDVIGNGNAVTASLTVSGGTFTSSNNGGLTLALSGTSTGTFTVTGGSATVSSLTFTGAGNTGGTATVNLNGGTLTASAIRNGSGGGTTTLNFNGGTLTARATNATFLSGLSRANVRDGGAAINTNGFNVTVAQALVHSNIGGDLARDGGLVKSGAGVLTLSGVNSYTGNTVVNGGTLVLADNAVLAFSSIGGAFNTISGSGAVTLDGDFLFDLTSVGSGVYTIVDSSILGNTTHSATFSVANAGWTESGNVWTSSNGLASYSELTGRLTVVPEPRTALLLGGSLLLTFVFRRFRMKSAA